MWFPMCLVGWWEVGLVRPRPWGPVGCRQQTAPSGGGWEERVHTPTADGSYRTSRDFLGHLLFVQPVGCDLAKSHKLFLAGPEQRGHGRGLFTVGAFAQSSPPGERWRGAPSPCTGVASGVLGALDPGLGSAPWLAHPSPACR